MKAFGEHWWFFARVAGLLGATILVTAAVAHSMTQEAPSPASEISAVVVPV